MGYQSFSRLFTTPFCKEYWAESSTYIHPNFFHAMLGSHLVDFGLRYLKETNIKSVFAFVFTNNEPILKIAHGLDFVTATKIDGHFFNDGHDRFILLKKINE